MTTAFYGRFSFGSANFGRMRVEIQHLATRLRTAKAKRKVYRQCLQELEGLSHRELADIGIPAANIRRVAREQANKEYPNV